LFQQTDSPNSQFALRRPNSDIDPAFVTLSDFRPTQRFGLVVLAGCIIDILANLFVLPLFGHCTTEKARLRMWLRCII
jgi:hypothetical protein